MAKVETLEPLSLLQIKKSFLKIKSSYLVLNRFQSINSIFRTLTHVFAYIKYVLNLWIKFISFLPTMYLMSKKNSK